MADRAKVLEELASDVLAVQRSHPVRVAIDGCSAAGKTTLADELADVLRARTDREIIRAGIDYFKRAPELRTAYPIDSPESYYLDMWDYDAVRNQQLLVRQRRCPGLQAVAGDRILQVSSHDILSPPTTTAAVRRGQLLFEVPG